MLKEEDYKLIVNQFREIENTKDLLSLINYVDSRLNNQSKRKNNIKLKTLHYYAFKKKDTYRTFSIPKKSGSKRIIDAPENYLKRIQIALNKILLQVHKPTYSSHGFLNNRNIVTNATPHIGKQYVFNSDIKDFFPSINFRRIKTVLELDPFALSGKKEDISFLVANLVTNEGVLPQGAPTSPIITNIVCQKLDRRLLKFAISRGVKYTRYADDITFSSNKHVYNNNFIAQFNEIIQSENFELNTNKTRISNTYHRQEVTGLVVNSKLNVNRNYVQTIRAILNNWEKSGLTYANKVYKEHLGRTGEFQKANVAKVLRGKIDFLGLVKGKNNPQYLRLKHRLEIMDNRIEYAFVKEDWVRSRLDRDNVEMERVFLSEIPHEDKFVSFSIWGFQQIENLINYYYYKLFPKLDDLKEFMVKENPPLP